MKNARWITDKYIYIMLLAFPLFTGFRGYASITLSKYLFFVCATLLWLLLSGGCLLAAALRGERPRLRAGAAGWFTLGLMAVSCVSALCSPWLPGTLLGTGRYDGLVSTLLYGAIFLGVSALGQARRGHIYALGLGTLFCCGLCALQLRGLNPLGLYPGSYDYFGGGVDYSGQFLGTLGNVDVLAAYLCLGAPMFTVAALMGRGRDRLLLIPALAALWALYRSGVAAGMVGCGGCLLVCLPLLMKSRRAALIILAAEALCALAVLAAVYVRPPESGTLWELSRILHGDIRDEFGSSRVLIWRETLRAALERPLIGGGPGTLAARLDIHFSRYVNETGRTLATYVDNAHNVYLGTLADTGILGLGCLLGAMVSSLAGWIKKRRLPLAAALGAGVLCCWIQDMFGLGLCLTAPMLWLCWALIGTTEEPRELCEAFFNRRD